jgi:hypothetical protein
MEMINMRLIQTDVRTLNNEPKNQFFYMHVLQPGWIKVIKTNMPWFSKRELKSGIHENPDFSFFS